MANPDLAPNALQKWSMETRHEAKDRRDREKQAELDRCYADVDARDRLHSRRSGQLLIKGSLDPHRRIERHHMQARGPHPELIYESSNVISLSAAEHAEVKAGKARYSGDANLRDTDGRLCGVLYERMTDAGWKEMGMI